MKHKWQWADMIECALNETDKILGPGAPLYLATDSYAAKHMIYGGHVRAANLTL